jgi:hypothetical protein
MNERNDFTNNNGNDGLSRPVLLGLILTGVLLIIVGAIVFSNILSKKVEVELLEERNKAEALTVTETPQPVENNIEVNDNSKFKINNIENIENFNVNKLAIDEMDDLMEYLENRDK